MAKEEVKTTTKSSPRTTTKSAPLPSSSGVTFHPMIIPSFLVGILVGLVFTHPFFGMKQSAPTFEGSQCYYSETQTDLGTNQELLVISDLGNNSIVGVRNFNSADSTIEPVRSYYSGKVTKSSNFGQQDDAGTIFNTIMTSRLDGEYETKQMVFLMGDNAVTIGSGIMTNVRGTFFFENPASVSFTSAGLPLVDCSTVPNSIK